MEGVMPIMNDNPTIVDKIPEPRPFEKLVIQLNQPSPRANRINEAALRDLCALCRTELKDPEVLQERLLQAGLNYTLAGNIKALFKCEDALNQFLRAEKPISWAAALALVWEFVTAKVRQILSDDSLADSRENQGRLFQLCVLAVEWGRDPENFRRLLVSSGMRTSRASEIKSVLECKPLRAQLLKEHPTITWNDALQKSRQLKQSQELQADHALKLLARQLIGRIVRRLERHRPDTLSKDSFTITRTGPGGFDVVVTGHGTLHLEPKPPGSNHLPANPQSL